MTVLHETISVSRSPEDCFSYLKDFSRCQEWDPGVVSARRLDSGPLAPGSRFSVRCRLPAGSIELQYEMLSAKPEEIILRGTCSFFEVIDTITITPTAAGCDIGYRAAFTFEKPLNRFTASFEQGMQAMGRKAVAGLETALQDEFPTPEISSRNQRSDRHLLSALSLFTRRGYRRGVRHEFNAISAAMTNKHVVITGASSGLGLATARDLAARGARLTLVMRNPVRAEQLVDELQSETGNTLIKAEIADLSLMSEVDGLVGRLRRSRRPIDVLVNNAGALFNELDFTEEGFEQSFALLLLSPYRLTLGLKPLLARAAGARVINVVSGGLYSQRLQVDKLQDTSNYSGSTAYAKAKRGLLVVTEEWAKQWEDENITVNAMHPGWADTPGVESSLPVFHTLTQSFLRSAEEGADTIIWLAVATEAAKATGKFFLDREPRTPHLISKTVEEAGERGRLLSYLESPEHCTDFVEAGTG